MFLTSKARYGLMIITDIAMQNRNQIVKPKDIAMRQDIDLSYVKRICNLYKNNGILESFMGINGGYKLIKDRKDLTILEIILASGESIKMTMCSMKDKDYPCNRKQNKMKCVNHGIWKALTIHTSNFFKNITLEELIQWLNEDEDYKDKILEKFLVKAH
jgi:Rrf2 family iron-sulfur cluster assembly transcriptional regulator